MGLTFDGNDSGQLQGVSTNFINAATVETDGVDVSADWNIPAGDMADFGVQLAYSQFLSYEIITVDGNGGTRDVVGSFNHDNFVRSMPREKVEPDCRLGAGQPQC